MRQIGDERREPLRYVAAGVVYLLLSGALFLFWLSVNHMILLVLSLSTVVAGLVDLSVGWPHLRSALAKSAAQKRAVDERTPHKEGRPR